MSDFDNRNTNQAETERQPVLGFKALISFAIIATGAAAGWMAFESIAMSVTGVIVGPVICLLIGPLGETLKGYMERFCT